MLRDVDQEAAPHASRGPLTAARSDLLTEVELTFISSLYFAKLTITVPFLSLVEKNSNEFDGTACIIHRYLSKRF